VAVCGAKGTGKSSFGRLLANSLLTGTQRVAWLDADCGQPEFTIPGKSTVHQLLNTVLEMH
jgi:polynucleotide 5'-hydroxyl-kinase GRC3/NOL9